STRSCASTTGSCSRPGRAASPGCTPATPPACRRMRMDSDLPRAAPAPSRALDLVAGSLLGVALLLLLKRYAGINHDAVLYLGQGLVRRWPEIFGHDLTFVHGGGQERYTVFPWLIEHA